MQALARYVFQSGMDILGLLNLPGVFVVVMLSSLFHSMINYKYHFNVIVENTLCSGDHVSWHSSLDGSESRIQHMLMTEDFQLQPISTPHGSVSFVQVHWCFTEECIIF